MIKLVIADDHTIVRSGLKQLIALAPDLAVVGEAVNGAEVLACLQHAPFDLLLLDLNMPGISGADLIARIKAHQPHLPILVLSMHDRPAVATQVLRAGADGFITKDCEPEVLLSAIRKVAAHGRYLDPDLAAQMAFDASSAEQRPAQETLSERERVVLRLLTRGLGVKEIGAQLAISGKTVSTHKARLMEKLGTSSMADLMRYALAHESPG